MHLFITDLLQGSRDGILKFPPYSKYSMLLQIINIVMQLCNVIIITWQYKQ